MKKYSFTIAVFFFFVLQASAAHPRKVLILATGGTIAGVGALPTQTAGYTAAVLPVDHLIAAVPQIKDLALVTCEQLAQVDSKNMTPAIWLKLAARINKAFASGEADGVVVTHGTDTLEETAYFLNLTIHSRKPVVLTGAMRPATALSADGPMNLYNAVAVAASTSTVGRGVLVCLNGQINGARDVTKTNTVTLDTFRSGENGLLGGVYNGKPVFYKATTRKHTDQSEFNVAAATALPKVEILYGYAGASTAVVEGLVGAGLDGIVYAGAGDGSIYETVVPSLVRAATRGAVIVRASRTGNGMVIRNGEEQDDLLGFVTADDLSPQKARILLMLGLTKTCATDELQRMFDQY